MSKAAELASLIGNINAGGGGVNRNLIINGAMNVSQRGTSSISAGFQTVDRFKNGVQTIGITQSQESLSSGEPFEKGFTKFYRQTVTSPSSATNVIMEIKHSIEAQNIANSGWDFKNANRPLSLSFYARSSVAGTYYSYVRNTDASPEQYYRFSFVLSANTWTKVEKTIAGNSNLVFPTDTGEGLAIFWVPAFGTNYSGSSVNLDQWETLTGSDYIPDITHAWGNTNGATFDLTGVQLEVGQNPTEFEHEPFDVTLRKCYRYFQKQSYISGTYVNVCYAYDTGSSRAVQYYAPKLKNPTITTSGTLSVYHSAGDIDVPTNQYHDLGLESCRLTVTLSGESTTAGYAMATYTTTAYDILIDAEL